MEWHLYVCRFAGTGLVTGPNWGRMAGVNLEFELRMCRHFVVACRPARLRVRIGLLFFAGLLLPLAGGASQPESGPADRWVEVSAEEMLAAQTPEVSEGYVPPVSAPPPAEAALFGAYASSVQQHQGALSGRIVYMNSGHGWTYDPNYWRLQRGVGNDMNEDYGNLDQLNFFAQYCFNAGATVVSFRPLGHQTNEVILDNDDPGVTFAGSWSDSSQTVFWGSAGDVPYRFASLSATETATATYTPNLPVAGFYPVYTWVLNGSDRGDQLYRIRHTGGEAQVRIPHHMVGNGWIYLGEYYFNAGANAALGAVVVSNLRGSPQGNVVIADAIRFGNGMGSVNRGSGVSGYPREEENMRYWVQANLGQGQSSSLYDGSGADESDSWSAPPKMSAHMNREAAGTVLDRIHISFHSNAGGGRGVVGLITGTPTPYQSELAYLCGKEVNDDLVALGSPPLEYAWYNRGNSVTYTGAYGEITGSYFNYEMPATIIEVAFHDNASDAALMRDPKARAAVARASLHAVIKFMHQYDTNNPAPLAFLPEPPANVRAVATGPGQAQLTWAPPTSQGGSQNATNYVIYRSTNGYGFGNPVAVGNVTSTVISNLSAGVAYYFRVTAANAGGESMPSETVGCRTAVDSGAPRVLVVNAFDRLDRTGNLRQGVAAQNWGRPGNTGSIERVYPRWNNAFDYVVAHGQAISAAGWAFDACQNETVANGQIALANYAVVIWAAGNQGTAEETFKSIEQSRLITYLNAGGALFASGADIAYDLGRPSGPTAADRNFLQNQLRAGFGADNSGSYTANATATGIFAGRAGGVFDNGNNGIYWVKAPDVLVPAAGAVAALNYANGSGAAAVQYDGANGGGRVVVFGFPFETLTSATRRNEYMQNILNFLGVPPVTNAPPAVVVAPTGGKVVIGGSATLTVVASGTAPLSYQWRLNGVNLPGATGSSYTRNGFQPGHSGFYDVVITNAWGQVTSVPVLWEAMLPPVQTLFSDDFDINTMGNWILSSSSADTRVTFNYNYAADGIASAPNSVGGTTRGVKFEANLANGAVAALNISPVGQSFGGDYRLHFDMWINVNGPLPDGGTGSTEHLTAGVGTTGDHVQWSPGSADGVWFAVDGEGGAADSAVTASDWQAYVAGTVQLAGSGVYAGGTETEVRGNGHPYYADTFPGGQTAPALQQANHPQQTGALAVGTVGLAWRDVIVNKTGNQVEWWIDGLKIATVPGVNLTASNVFIGYWDAYASISDNASLSFGLVDNVRVERLVTNVPPYITAPPVPVAAATGANVVFSVAAGGTPPLTYQWQCNGTNIAGANASTCTLLNVQAAQAGNYVVVVTNASGTVSSSPAALILTPSLPLHFTAFHADANGLQLQISGDPGFAVEVQTSTNLTDWSVLTNLVNPTGTFWFTNQFDPAVPEQFFRMRYP